VRRVRRLALVHILVGQLALGCGPAAGAPGTPCDPVSACNSGMSCIVGRCRPTDAAPSPPDTTRVLLPAAEIAILGSGTVAPEEGAPEVIPFGREAAGSVVVLLRFAASWRDEADVVSAFVVLDPLEGAPPAQSPVRIEIARILEPWTSATATWGRQPRLTLPELGAIVRPHPPGPLRIEVTRIVRDWSRRSESDHGIALLASGSDPFGAMYTSGLTSGKRPRLEAYVR
jgi:hypothetical protein